MERDEVMFLPWEINVVFILVGACLLSIIVISIMNIISLNKALKDFKDGKK